MMIIKASNQQKSALAYSFRLIDLTKMYMAFGSSMKSEKEAFDRAMMMLLHLDIARLDRYYSNPAYVDMFGSKGVDNIKVTRLRIHKSGRIQ